MPRPIRATINPQAIVHNYRWAKARAPHSKVWAVLKANAYGHGVEVVGLALADIADGFAVLDLSEAVALRRLGCNQPIILLEGLFSPEDLIVAGQYGLTPVVASPEQAKMMADHANALSAINGGATIALWIKIKSTMNRLGLSLDEAEALWLAWQNHSLFRPEGMMVHLPNNDAPLQQSEFEARQAWAEIQPLLARCSAPLSIANSAAIFALPPLHTEVVREGIALYGASPFAHQSAQELGLMPAMRLTAEIIALHTLEQGDAVGYGSRYRAEARETIAVVSCGYADGYPRHAPDGTPTWVEGVEGVECPLVGRVSMDMLTINVSKIQQPKVGMRVELWGANVAVDCVAQNAGTVGYELLCAVAPRVARFVEDF